MSDLVDNLIFAWKPLLEELQLRRLSNAVSLDSLRKRRIS